MQKVAHKGEFAQKEVEKVPGVSSMVKEFKVKKENRISLQMPAIIIAVAILVAGVFTGFILAGLRGNSSGGGGLSGGVLTGLTKSVGKCDSKKVCGEQSPEGVLREGGTEGGEGTHHLERPGGPSQSVYLTSSTIPLDDYIGKQVKVSGETFDAETAGWLMDVYKLEMQ